MEQNKKIILFDGVCNLCNGAVNFVIKRDRKGVFRFASLQGKAGKKLLEELHIDPEQTDSIILIEPEMAYYIKSEAALEIAKELGWPWKALTVFQLVLPGVFRDKVYDLVAANRYRWFGKSAQCMLPSPDVRSRFLDDPA